MLGRVFESRGQLDQARTAYGEAAALDPTWPSPRIGVLGVRLRQGDADGVLAALRALPEEFRTTGEAELLLGRVLAQKEEWASAGAAFDRAAALLPGLAEVQALRGDAAYNAGELKPAADAYGRAVELDPANLAYRTSHALHLGYDGRREEAIAALLEVTAKPEGQTPETLMALGGIYRGFEPPRVAEAVAAYEKALKLDPKNGQAALGVARSYRAGRQWARAIAAYERVSTRVSPARPGGPARHGLVLPAERRRHAGPLLHGARGPRRGGRGAAPPRPLAGGSRRSTTSSGPSWRRASGRRAPESRLAR